MLAWCILNKAEEKVISFFLAVVIGVTVKEFFNDTYWALIVLISFLAIIREKGKQDTRFFNAVKR